MLRPSPSSGWGFARSQCLARTKGSHKGQPLSRRQTLTRRSVTPKAQRASEHRIWPPAPCFSRGHTTFPKESETLGPPQVCEDCQGRKPLAELFSASRRTRPSAGAFHDLITHAKVQARDSPLKAVPHQTPPKDQLTSQHSHFKRSESSRQEKNYHVFDKSTYFHLKILQGYQPRKIIRI